MAAAHSRRPAGRGGERRSGPCIAIAALTLAFGAGLGVARAEEPVEPKPPPKIDTDLKTSVEAGGKTVEVTIKYPSAEKKWAESVKATIEKGLPKVAAAAGFAPPREALEVRFAFGPAETEGYEALLKTEALMVRKKCSRGGYHAHYVLYGLARLFAEQAVRPEWLRAGLAHLAVLKALEELPSVYDARTYRDEVLEEVKKATDEAPLDQWIPVPPGGGATPAEQPVPIPEVARAFGFLYAVDYLHAGAVLKALGESGRGGSAVGTKEFVEAVGKAAGGPVTAYFTGWGYADPSGSGPAPRLDKTDLLDSDDDGLLNFQEKTLGTDKSNADTDRDGASDWEEVLVTKTDPKTKDAPRARVKIDGDGREWLRLKKFTFQDKVGDAKEAITGADLKAVKLCADKDYIYVLVEADSTQDPDVAYQLCFDAGDDGVDPGSNDPAEQRKAVWNHVIGFRGDGSRWIGDTHNDKDWSWAEWKNNRRMALAAKEGVIEVRVPLDAMDLPPKFLFMAYTTAKDGSLVTDSVIRQVLELAKWRQ